MKAIPQFTWYQWGKGAEYWGRTIVVDVRQSFVTRAVIDVIL